MVGVGVRRKQLVNGGQLVNIIQAVVDVGLCYIGAARILCQRGGGLLPHVARVNQGGDGVIRHIVHRVHAAAGDIQHNIVPPLSLY